MVRALSIRADPWPSRSNLSGGGWWWMMFVCLGLSWTRSCSCTSEALTTSEWFRPRRQLWGLQQSSRRGATAGLFPVKSAERWATSPPRGGGDAAVPVTTSVLQATRGNMMDGDGSVYWRNGASASNHSVYYDLPSNNHYSNNNNNHAASTTVLQKPKKKKNGFEKSVPVECVAETKLPTDVGHFQLRAYRIPTTINGSSGSGSGSGSSSSSSVSDLAAAMEPCVIYNRDKPPFGKHGKLAEDVPVRIHDQCLTSEVFRSQRCDCKEQFKMALEYVQKNGGAIVYLQQEGRGIGLANKVAAYSLQDSGMDTVEANLHLGFPEDCRTYGVVPSILRDLNIASIQLMTNNPRKVERLKALGVKVTNTLPMVIPQANPYNRRYLETKQERMNHVNLRRALYHQSNGSMLPKKAQHKRNGQTAKPATALLNKNGMSLDDNNAFKEKRDYPELGVAATDAATATGLSTTTNTIQVSLFPRTTSQRKQHPKDVHAGAYDGVKASKDGYCFGRQSVEQAIAAISRGEMVVVVDDMDRENEGDLIMAADQCSPEDMAKIIRYSSGVVCVSMEGHRMKELELPPMVTSNQDPKGTAFSVTVDATKQHGITTGISARDRSKTIQLLADAKTTTGDLSRPGHVFPLRARSGGVLARDGHTEASVDLAKLAGRAPCGVLCEIVSEEHPTEMARLPELRRFCQKHGMVLTSIVDLIQYRRDTERNDASQSAPQSPL